MTKLFATVLLAGALPLSASAQNLNADYVTAYIQDSNGANPIGVGGRYSISPQGKIVGDLTYWSDNDIDASTTSIRAGYRHTIGQIDALANGLLSVGGGLTYVSASVGATTVSDTDFYIESDMEFAVGRSGVAHAVIAYQNSDFQIGGGYTHYFGPQWGVRGEAILDGPIEVGAVYKF